MDLYNLSIHLFFSIIILVALYVSFRSSSQKKEIIENLIPCLVSNLENFQPMRSKVNRTLRVVEEQFLEAWQISFQIATKANELPNHSCLKQVVALAFLPNNILKNIENLSFEHSANNLKDLKSYIKKTQKAVKISYSSSTHKWSFHD